MADVHFPNLLAEGHHAGQPVAPTYAEAPAPMGVADIGLRDVAGAMAGYILNTSSARGTINFTEADSVYVDGDGPDMFGVQLNSVLTNVTLFGTTNYTFWTQNFVSYTPSSGQLVFGDNIWNFTNLSGNISSNVFYAHGPNGTLYAPVLYLAVGPTFTIHYPFSLTFYLNSTSISGRPAAFFNYTVANSTEIRSGSFDYVIFNSSLGPPRVAAPPAYFQVNGEAYDGIGLINDIELSLLGNDNGDTTTFYQLNATATIAYWNASAGTYRPVPSAVNAGADTGETSDGIASYYVGNSSVARLSIGPSFLEGLWNSTSPPGERTVIVDLDPAPTLILVNPGASRHASSAQWVFSSPSGVTTMSLPNSGQFYFDFRLSEYAPTSWVLANGNPNGTVDRTVDLTSKPSLGIYTPLIAIGNSELAVFAQSGSGTAADPYVLYDNEPGNLDGEFAQWNDFQFPVFPGLLLISTTAFVRITPTPFSITYPSYMLNTSNGIYPFGLSTTNNLQLEFWNVSNVTLIGGPHITGWLSASLFSFYPLGETIFWNSTGNLIAGNTFDDQGIGLALYGGRNNTVWGNSFLVTGVAASKPQNVLENPANQTGLWESESGDLVYNNYFSVPVTAYTPAFDPLSCQNVCAPAQYSDTWNVTREGTGVTRTVLGTSLNGSIVSTDYQGGNYWSNYGTASDPYGVLPYNASGWITRGGDFVPLVPFSLYSVTFKESGLPSGAVWGINSSLRVANTSASSLVLDAPNGTYSYAVTGAPGYTVDRAGYFTVAGRNVTVTVNFAASGTASGGIGTEGGWIIAALAAGAIALGILLAIVLVRRRRPSPPAPPPPPPEEWREVPPPPDLSAIAPSPGEKGVPPPSVAPTEPPERGSDTA